MADRLIAAALGKYLSVFVKNWSKDKLSVSVVKGYGKLSDLEVREEVIQEVLDIPFIKVKKAHLNEISLKIPALTKLKTAPLIFSIGKFELEIEEPIEYYEPTDIIERFLKTFSTDDGNKKKKKKTKYSSLDRLVDGIKFEVEEIKIKMTPLGYYPSKKKGPWTPPTMVITISKFTCETTDNRWKIVDLKQAIPKQNKKEADFFVHKLGALENIKVEFYDEENKLSTLIDNISYKLKLTQRKKTSNGMLLGINVEIEMDNVKLDIQKDALQHLTSFLASILASQQRDDLYGPYNELKRKKRKQQKEIEAEKKEKLERQDSQMSMQSSTSSTRSKNNSVLKYINHQRTKSSDTTTSFDDMSFVSSTEDFSIIDSDDDSLMTESVVVGAILEELGEPGSKPRIMIKLMLNELSIKLHTLTDVNYQFEMLGFVFSLILNDDGFTSKDFQLIIPYIMVLENNAMLADMKKKREEKKLSDFELHALAANERLSQILGPRDYVKLASDEDEHEHTEYTIKDENWPEFVSTSRYYPKDVDNFNSYRPADVAQRQYFKENKEIVKMRYSTDGELVSFECRVNPVEAMLNANKIVEFVDYVFETLPDWDIKPEAADRIHFKKYSGHAYKDASEVEEISDQEDEDDDEKSGKIISFFMEIRNPSILIPSNTKGDIDDISELVRLSALETLISSDAGLQEPNWVYNTLYEGKNILGEYEFPSKKSDTIRLVNTLWDRVPNKFEFQINRFTMHLLPSINGIPSVISKPINATLNMLLNDTSIEENEELPRVTLIGSLEKFELFVNQNQAILLLELIRTYTDDPPQFSNLMIRNTKSIRDRIKEKQESKKVTKENEIKEVVPILAFFKIDSIDATILTGDQADMNSGTELARLTLGEMQAVIETHHIDQLLLFKGDINSISLETPPEDGSSLNLTHKIINTILSKDESCIKLRYEFPLYHILNKDIDFKDITCSINPLVTGKINNIHMGLNAKSIFQIVKYVESRANMFECSPLEITKRTVTKASSIIKERYIQKKETEEILSRVTDVDSRKVDEEDTEEDPTLIEDNRMAAVRAIDNVTNKVQQKFNEVPRFRYPHMISLDIHDSKVNVIGGLKEEDSFGIYIGDMKIEHLPLRAKTDEEKSWTKEFPIELSKGDHETIEFDFTVDNTLQYSIEEYIFSLNYNARHFSVKVNDVDHSSAMGVQFHFYGDHGMPLSRHALRLNVNNASSEILNMDFDATDVYTIVQVVLCQIEELKTWTHLLKFIKPPVVNLKDNFARLREKLGETQMSLSKVKFHHEAAKEVFSKIHQELFEREEALQYAIQDKIALTQRLSEYQFAQYSDQDVNTTLKDAVNFKLSGFANIIEGNKPTKVYVVLYEGFVGFYSRKILPDEVNQMDLLVVRFPLHFQSKVTTSKMPFKKKSVTVIILEHDNGDSTIFFFDRVEVYNAWNESIKKEIATLVKEEARLRQIEGSSEVAIQTESTETPTQQYMKELENMNIQYMIMKNALKMARKDEDILRERLNELARYVEHKKFLEERHEKEIQHKVSQIADKSTKEREQKEYLKSIQLENERLKAKLQVKEEVLRKTKKKHRAEYEEQKMLIHTLKDNIVAMSQQMLEMEEQETRVRRENDGLKRSIRQLDISSKVDGALENYQRMQDHLHRTIEKKNTEIRRLLNQNVELSHQLSTFAQPKSPATPSSPATPLPSSSTRTTKSTPASPLEKNALVTSSISVPEKRVPPPVPQLKVVKSPQKESRRSSIISKVKPLPGVSKNQSSGSSNTSFMDRLKRFQTNVIDKIDRTTENL